MSNPKENELKMTEENFIVSKTDMKGNITYGNRDFMHFSGLKESQFLGKPHRIIRHPDMPRAIFKIMWDNLKDKKEFFGFIKNINIDGSYYWTYANVTPSYDPDGKLIGYFSVRRKPYESSVDFFTKIYKKMLNEEKKYKNRNEAMEASTAILQEAIISAGGSNYDEFMFTE